MTYVNYEQHGAVGDGVHNDFSAICAAHAFANKNKLQVKAKADATYYIGKSSETAIITTNTDWNTARFIVDDQQAGENKKSIFVVQSTLKSEEIELKSLSRDQNQHSMILQRDHYVRVLNENKMRYIRKGKNQNDGSPQQDCFILKKCGDIEGSIDWDYREITRIESKAIDEKLLTISGGVFNTVANNMIQSHGSNYWARNIKIERSNTSVQDLFHYVSHETSCGHPYSGFVVVSRCAHVTLKNCFFSGHKIYSTIGSIGERVQMGSYDINANSVVNLLIEKCSMNHILDKTRWGVFASNFCKNISVKDSHLSRLDAHMGVSGTFFIERCTLGHAGLNAIGKGILDVRSSTLYGRYLVNFRDDYGGTWDGLVKIRDCKWIPSAREKSFLHLFGFFNDGTHDFGFKCFMPKEVIISNLHVQDENNHENCKFLYMFTDPDKHYEGSIPIEARPFPYTICKHIKVNGLNNIRKMHVKACSNEHIDKRIPVIIGNEKDED